MILSSVLHESRPPWVDRLLAELAASDQRAERVAKDLSAAQLNWQPSPEKWSVGQCLEHLRRTNEGYLPAIAASLQAREKSTVSEIHVPRLSKWFIRNYIAPNPGGMRAKAPKTITPESSISPDILQQFLMSNARAGDLVLQAANFDVNRIRFQNPFVPLLRFTVGTGLEIISKHESRHLLQAESVRSHPGFPR